MAAVSLGLLATVGAASQAQSETGKFEVVPAGEAAQIDQIAKDTVALQDRRAEKHEAQKGRLLRGVHAKSHGCVKAEFVVEQTLREEHKVGLFAEPGRRFEAVIRFSNASVVLDDDLNVGRDGKRKNGSRGMALKIHGVPGEVLQLDNGEANQDFLMINTPEFAFANTSSYSRLTKALLASEKGDDPKEFFAPLAIFAELQRLGAPKDGEPPEDTKKRQALGAEAAKPGFKQRVLEAKTTLDIIGEKIQSPDKTVRNPLDSDYFGGAAFQFGPDHAMKVSTAPCSGYSPRDFDDAERAGLSANYLGEALAETMKGPAAQCFDFRIQIRDDKKLAELNIEDATKIWPNELDNYETVAKIHIEGEQDLAAGAAACERLVFSPWQGLAAHQPLGGINRLRQSVYSNSASHRGAVKK